MKALAESILSRSGHSGKETMNRLIREWLDEYGVKNYTINDDYTIDVDGYVNLVGKDLTEFPEYIQFGIVKGDFNCSGNGLISLRGCPREVRLGNFLCNHNQLTSLEGVPKKVEKIFDCSNNKLTSLEGAPKEVRWNFDCSRNELTSLEGAPREVGRHFDCSRNSTQFTEEDVRKVCNVKRKIIV